MTTKKKTRIEPTAADRAEFELWKMAEERRIFDLYRIEFWNERAVRRARKDPAKLDFWVGPWHTVAPYISTELRELVDAGEVRRWTVTEWSAARHAERESVRANSGGASDYVLRDLELWRELDAKRGEMIELARGAGLPWSAILEASGMSRANANTLRGRYLADERERAEMAAVFESELTDDGMPF